MFSVRPGIRLEDALVHASLSLGCAAKSTQLIVDQIAGEDRALAWATLHAVEQAKGLIDAVLDGIEARSGG